MQSARYTVPLHSLIDTPDVGFTIYRLSTDGLFYAKLSNGNVVLLGSGNSSNILLNNIIIPVGEGNATLTSTEVELDAIQLSNDVVFTVLSFVNLTTINYAIFFKDCSIGFSNPVLNFPALDTCPLFILDNLQFAQSINIPLLQTASKITIINSAALTDILVHPALQCLDVDFSNNALNQATVDAVLASLVAGGAINGVLEIDGGTNSPPTGGGANADYQTLLANGWTVSINP